MFNITFFTTANDIAQPFNCWLLACLTLIFVICLVTGIVSFLRNKQIPIICLMLGIWFLSGTLLCCISDSSFISDWINTAVAIGTAALAVFAWVAYKDYWRQKRQNEVFMQIINLSNLLINDTTYLYLNINNYLMNQYRNFNKNIPIKFTLNYVTTLLDENELIQHELKKFKDNTAFKWQSQLKYVAALSCVESQNHNVDILNETNNNIKKLILEVNHIYFHILRINHLYKTAKKKIELSPDQQIGFSNKLIRANLSTLKEITQSFTDFITKQLCNHHLSKL